MIIVLDWWLQQLAAMLPAAVLSRSAPLADAAILEIDDDAAALLVRQRGAVTRLAEASADPEGLRALVQVMADHRAMPHRLVLRLPSLAVLQKRLTLPLGARRHLQGLLGFEIDQETPFSRDEVHWGYAVRRQDTAHGQLAVDLVIALKALVDPVVAKARSAGFEPVGVEVASAADAPMLLRLTAERRWQALRAQRPLIILAAAACILAVTAVAAPFVRQQRALAAVDAAGTVFKRQAEEAATLRQSIDRLTGTMAYLKQQRDRSGDALAVLAAVTRILPDDTYLTSLNLHDGRVTMAGLSPTAAPLAELLARSPEFRDPTFNAPVVETEDSGLESFTISVALKTAGGS